MRTNGYTSRGHGRRRKRYKPKHLNPRSKRTNVMAYVICLAVIANLILTLWIINAVARGAKEKEVIIYEHEQIAIVQVTSKPVKDETEPKEVKTVVKKEEEKNTQEEEETKEKSEPVLSAVEPGTEYYYVISETDRKNLEKVVYQESRGEPFEGKVAVAAVVLNRYTSNDSTFHTESVTAVITQRYQFADISKTTQEQLDKVPECAEAVDAALRGWDPTRKHFPEGAKYFFEPAGVTGHQKEIREGIDYLQIGNHRFHNEFNVHD